MSPPDMGSIYWFIESGFAKNPFYFCMKMTHDGQPVWTRNIYEAQKFKNKEMAEAVTSEWCLSNVRITEHGIEE